MGLDGGINLFGYAGNTPLSYTDPMGHRPCNKTYYTATEQRGPKKKKTGLNCNDFVNWIVNRYFDSVSKETFAISIARIGFAIAHKRILPDNHGFKEVLVANDQGGDIYAHILVMAAFRVGSESPVLKIFLPDLQLKGMKLKDLYDSTRNAQGKTELLNDIVGQKVGAVLANAPPERRRIPTMFVPTGSRKKTKTRVRRLLCD